MRVTARLVGFPSVSEASRARGIEVELEEGSFRELARAVQRRCGDETGTLIADARGVVDPSLVVLRNGQWIGPDDSVDALRDGDEVTFLVLVAGG